MFAIHHDKRVRQTVLVAALLSISRTTDHKTVIMAPPIQRSASAPPQIILARDSGDAADIQISPAKHQPSLSLRTTDMINDAFPELEAQRDTNEEPNTTTSNSQEPQAAFASPSCSSSASTARDTSQNTFESDARHHTSPPEFEEIELSSDEPPPPYQCLQHDFEDRIISRVLVEAIFPPDPLWSPLRDGRPTTRPHKRFDHIVSLWPSTTLSEFKDVLMTGIKDRISASRTYRLRSAEVMQVWLYMEWGEIERSFLGFKCRKSKRVDVDESNWSTIVAALRGKTFNGVLKTMYWREVHLTEAERQKQQAVAQMYRNILRPYAAW
ncbi:hypothetical protein CERZMDRAFT_96831 [Cercospora zeae-maydis SCOH1-5]|uniref:Uncharacterized protein n=1 Tax=Cercospora zeae-maydis SCOH1-5 TaxID=717836 RepID=A0A6A6FIB4_9PEZI|nr:hypothetical protein CERZMDRAFT_96831 [Cercospora zeae-maydis SCOH1-5]